MTADRRELARREAESYGGSFDRVAALTRAALGLAADQSMTFGDRYQATLAAEDGCRMLADAIIAKQRLILISEK